MAWNPGPEVAVAREAARKLKAEVGVIIIYCNRETIGMASYGHNKELCSVMGKMGEAAHKAAMDYVASFDDDAAQAADAD